jgi:hypothetical protein
LRVDKNAIKIDSSYVVPSTIRSSFNITAKGNSTNRNQQAVAQFLDQYYNPQDLSLFLKRQGIEDIKVYKV